MLVVSTTSVATNPLNVGQFASYVIDMLIKRTVRLKISYDAQDVMKTVLLSENHLFLYKNCHA